MQIVSIPRRPFSCPPRHNAERRKPVKNMEDVEKKNLGGNISFHILEDGDSISQKCAKVEEW